MKKIIEANYVGVEEIYKLIDISRKLNNEGHYVRLTFDLDDDQSLHFSLIRNGYGVAKDFDIDVMIDIDDPKDVKSDDQTNYKRYVRLLEQINAVIDKEYGDTVIYPQWRKAEGDE